MAPENFTERVIGIINSASSFADSLGHQAVMPEHLLISVLNNDEDGFCSAMISKAGGNLSSISSDLEARINSFAKVSGSNIKIYMDDLTSGILSKSRDLAKDFGDSFVGVDILLLSFVCCENKAGDIIKNSGATKESLEQAVKDIRKGRSAQSPNADNNYQALRKYSVDLTESAKNGKLDPVIGREEEIKRTMQILCRRIKNNPILIGEPGVGKTAIVEGIAQRIAAGDVPEKLRGKVILSLDMGAMVAGAKFRGEFEERLKSILKEVESDPDGVIIFIDEIHTLVGAGRSDGAMDASNLMKPALARGELHCIGATTLDEYRTCIEKDAALARRFKKVYVSAPNVDETISILRGIKERYELHHGVRISDAAIVSAANLSDRYISDQFLPDKAIDLIDEAASYLKMQIDSKPEELDLLDREIMQKRIECEALKAEQDEASKERLKGLSDEITELEGRSASMSAKWQDEKLRLDRGQSLKEKLDAARVEFEQARREGNFSKAGELLYSIIPELEKKIADIESQSTDERHFLEEVVGAEHIAASVSRMTGIPVSKMLEKEKDKLLNMEDDLSERVVGQSRALHAVSSAIRRSRAGLSDPDRPMGSFLFLGPTGVGKTELARSLAYFLFDSEDSAFRIDMSEFMERHSVSRLIGAPPGYVGYEQGGVLTEAVRRRPYQVLLFDEIEKAHPDVFNIFLQILDAGRLTDGQGRIVNFTNTIIIMTSNLGSEYFEELQEGDDVQRIFPRVMEVVKRSFRPEFLNRLDDIIVFERLSKSLMMNIVDMQLKNLSKILDDKKIDLLVKDKAKEWLADKGYDPSMGARPLKRVIRKYLYDEVSLLILSGAVEERSIVSVEDYDSYNEKLNIVIENSGSLTLH